VPPTAAVLGLEGVGAVLLTVAGYLGGTLVTRNQISVDHRYARAGRWKEEKVEQRDGGAVVAAKADELEIDQMKLLHIDGRRIVLARTESGYVAFDDGCTHKGGSLAGGTMISGTVQCPWHGSQFDVRTGAVRAGPAREGIKTYRVEQRDGEVRLTL
jgi:nitrite reductase/ring-hydroxylating ferredoxin subunit